MANQDDKGVARVTAAVAEVRLDENGVPLSKNALKKLLKKEAADKKKAEKAAARVSLSRTEAEAQHCSDMYMLRQFQCHVRYEHPAMILFSH